MTVSGGSRTCSASTKILPLRYFSNTRASRAPGQSSSSAAVRADWPRVSPSLLLPSDATYIGFDISRTMVELAQDRVAPWAGCAEVQLTDGSPSLAVGDNTSDRFLSAYVLDLLGEEQIRAVLREAQRLLVPGGLLCLASLTFGNILRLAWCAARGGRLIDQTRDWWAVAALSSSRPLSVPSGAYFTARSCMSVGICTEVLIAALS